MLLSQKLSKILNLEEPAKKYTCLNCNAGFESTSEQRSHFKTEWHLYNLKRKVCRLEPIDYTSFQRIQDSAPIEVRSKDETRETRAIAKSEQQRQHYNQDQLTKQDEAADSEDDADWEEVDDEELLDEEYDEEEVEVMLARVVKSNTCLFCDKKSSKTRENLEHMNSRHGFFIPEEQYLIDLEGLMEYLGFKVGAGMTCLWCNKQFTTLHGARLHMLYKDHCKILYEHDKAIEEFKDFYDYSDQVQIQMKPLSQLVVSKKKRTSDSASPSVKHQTSRNSRQLVSRSGHSTSLVSQAYHSKRTIKKFNADRANRLLHIGMQNNNALRGRLRQQNPM